MSDRYFLYIDILGFADLVATDPKKVDQLFGAVNQLTAHQHGDFQTVVFSDTILIFNKTAPVRKHDHQYLVMYAIEFAQDLQKWCIKLDIQFRAVLVKGEFHYRKVENLEAYSGGALIKAYRKEKEINGIGLFIWKNIAHRNTIYKTVSFDQDLDFVFLTQNLESVLFYTGGELPIHLAWILESPSLPYLWLEVLLLKGLKRNMDRVVDSRVRAKYLQTYLIYRSRYPTIVAALEKQDFSLKALNSEVD